MTSAYVYLLLAVVAPVIVAQFAAPEEFGEATPDSAEDLSLPTPRGNVRLRCTDHHLKLYHNATTCHDVRSTESCRMIFPQALSTNPANRDPKCDDPLMEDISNQCRKTCGICCEDPNYSCLNDNTGIVNCEQNMEKCGQKEFAPMMIKYCPATCGLCLARKCRDQLEDCGAMKTLCNNDLYAVFMEHQCARTCGKCVLPKGVEEVTSGEEPESEEEEKESSVELPPLPPPSSSKKCVDLMKHCAKNKKFCNHPAYEEMMTKNCAKTCGKCDVFESGFSSSSSSKKSSSSGLTGASSSRGRGGLTNRRTGQLGGSRRLAECKDKYEYCRSWAKNGFCDSPEYSEDYKRETCAKSCELC